MSLNNKQINLQQLSSVLIPHLKQATKRNIHLYVYSSMICDGKHAGIFIILASM